jgi:hypothetical protein
MKLWHVLNAAATLHDWVQLFNEINDLIYLSGKMGVYSVENYGRPHSSKDSYSRSI